MQDGEGMKVVGRPRARSVMERFDRLQSMVGAVAARPSMRRGTVLRFRTFDEFDAWKRQMTRVRPVPPNQAIS
jgi:hypothetical protein